MSTDYYLLEAPITNLRIEPRGTHADISLWVNDGKAGTVTVRDSEVNEFIRLFMSDFDVLHTSWGGKSVGTIVRDEIGIPVDDATQVISEYGELLTAGQVRARAGAKRADGMPTELFGYEEATK